MPPPPPPPPGTLTVLLTLASVVMAWLAVAVEAAVRGIVGSWFGVPLLGLRLEPVAPWLVTALTGPLPRLAPGAVAFVTLSGTLALIALALATRGVLSLMRTRGLTRGLVHAGAVVAVLWVPAGLAAACVPGGGGPFGLLYARLGDPEAGRWTTAALALVLGILVARPLARMSVEAGRRWMRADGLAFRRRLVRVVAGYPGAIALTAVMLVAGWAPPALALAWSVVTLVTLRIQTE